MLKIDKNISLTAQSIVGDEVIANFTASISEEGQAQLNAPFILKPELYATNKKEVRKDLAAFQNSVFDLEDQASIATE